MDKAQAAERVSGAPGLPHAHDSARKQVTGEARYIDDMPEPAGLLHIQVGLSERAHAKLTKFDLQRVRNAPGVVAVLTAADVPGINDASPFAGDDPIFAGPIVEYAGQPIFAVVAESREQAIMAAHEAAVGYEDLEPVLTLDHALEQDLEVLPTHELCLGDPEAELERAPQRLQGRLRTGGQDHFYLEGQIALAEPGEDRDMKVLSSTQHPTEVQQIIAKALWLSNNAVTVEVRRMGGAFGGKESQAAHIAVIAALAADATGRPAKLRLDRDDDMLMTGKRHDFRIDYDVGFDDEGRLRAVVFRHAARCGRSVDLSGAIADRAMFHADNAYYLGAARITSRRMKTHTVSNTAFRGFGGPQGMIGIERVMDEIALHLGKDPLDVRKANFYGEPGRDLTPYHMTVEDSVIGEIAGDLEVACDYRARRDAIRAFNRASPVIKKGLALTPVKFGISFTTIHLNQASALIHLYTDGSITLHHGGTEMGQGLFVKVAQVVAETFQVDIERIKITTTSTDKVPNTSATAASSGSDLNGKAAEAAALTLRGRLIDFAADAYKVSREEIDFLPGRVRIGNQTVAFEALVKEAYMARVQLTATGFYKTPKIHYDREAGRGRPFFYFSYGAAASEVAIDTLTGESKVTRVDILHDAGRSLNPAIDLGQIEGGFVQGMGWLTTEELVWDDAGRLMTHAPSTYKIPACSDRPEDFRVRIWQGGRNREETIFRSKAVGEPPLMLAISVFSALTDAVASLGGYRLVPALDAPATPERILMACEDIKARASAGDGVP
jgi:xanthine dehydrogenase large subunit